jgi:hypothetical protein
MKIFFCESSGALIHLITINSSKNSPHWQLMQSLSKNSHHREGAPTEKRVTYCSYVRKKERAGMMEGNTVTSGGD